MNEALVTNWNALVSPKDEVYHLGDLSFGREVDTRNIIARLNGRIYLVRGNHDAGFLKRNSGLFTWVKDYYELKWNKQKFVLCHFPFAVWNESHHGSFHLHGHSHGTLPPRGRRRDVGVDCFDYRPVPIEVLGELLSNLDPSLEDYHKSRR